MRDEPMKTSRNEDLCSAQASSLTPSPGREQDIPMEHRVQEGLGDAQMEDAIREEMEARRQVGGHPRRRAARKQRPAADPAQTAGYTNSAPCVEMDVGQTQAAPTERAPAPELEFKVDVAQAVMEGAMKHRPLVEEIRHACRVMAMSADRERRLIAELCSPSHTARAARDERACLRDILAGTCFDLIRDSEPGETWDFLCADHRRRC